jgi:lysophospholipase L1-like esterase
MHGSRWVFFGVTGVAFCCVVSCLDAGGGGGYPTGETLAGGMSGADGAGTGGALPTGGATGAGGTTTGETGGLGGTIGTGGFSLGGGGTGGASSGGTSTGGSSTGGTATGGSSTGGTATGGSSTGGSSTGGGGTATGGSYTGGTDSGGAGGSGGFTHEGDWRVMPLGDSITGTTCYPQLLDQSLRAEGRSNFELVGTVLNNQACDSAPFVQSEGHGGYLVVDLVGSGSHASELTSWCAADQADVVLMHFGTNDVWNNRPPQEILDAYTGVLAALRQVVPNVLLFVAQLIPMTPDNCAECNGRVQALNAAIPDWAAQQSTQDSPVYVVDQYSGFDTSVDTGDGVHPNIAGSQKMADRWAQALSARGVL